MWSQNLRADDMPIKPENKKRYPADWTMIVELIRVRSGNRCECTGECGDDHHGRCGLEHLQVGYRHSDGRFFPHLTTDEVVSMFGEFRSLRRVKIVLTTAHLDHVPEHCDPSNLRHMCQRCHLLYDREHHKETAAATRRAADESRVATGEMK